MNDVVWLAIVTQTWVREDGQLMIDEYNYGIYTGLEAAQAALDMEVDEMAENCHPNWVIGEIATNAVSVNVLKVYLDQQHAGNEVSRRVQRNGIWSDWKTVLG